MPSRYTTFSYSDATHEILTEMERRNLRKSGVIRDLLQFFHEHGYQIPKSSPVETEAEKDARRQMELDAEAYRQEQEEGEAI